MLSFLCRACGLPLVAYHDRCPSCDAERSIEYVGPASLIYVTADLLALIDPAAFQHVCQHHGLNGITSGAFLNALSSAAGMRPSVLQSARPAPVDWTPFKREGEMPPTEAP